MQLNGNHVDSEISIVTKNKNAYTELYYSILKNTEGRYATTVLCRAVPSCCLSAASSTLGSTEEALPFLNHGSLPSEAEAEHQLITSVPQS